MIRYDMICYFEGMITRGSKMSRVTVLLVCGTSAYMFGFYLSVQMHRQQIVFGV